MPRLTIDNREIEVPVGTKVIEAAERLGIMIPRFCYHPGMGSVGACRVCAVKFVEGPVKGILMSCMLDAKDGMVVSTTDEEAVEFRKFVIELLMKNHPHDCPVCDEGGHCLLQDMTVSSGHGHRRYLGKKRTYVNQNLGPFVDHEMNRCIQCYRCSRFYQEFAGYRDYGVMQIADRVYFGRSVEGRLESPFAGNVVDLCPTGVLIDKPSRNRVRRWHLQRGPSLCINCSLGCGTVGNVYLREMMRVEANFNQAVNGYFICDRGRYGFYYDKLEDRPRRAVIDSWEAASADAVAAAAERLGRIAGSAGGRAVACLGSARSSIETLGMLKHSAKTGGWREPVFFMDAARERKTRLAVSGLEQSVAVSMRDIEKADFILAVGADPVNEAPMLAIAMRQAARRGAFVAVVDPRPVSLPFDFQHIAAPVRDIDRLMNVIMREAIPNEDIKKALGSLAGLWGEGGGTSPADMQGKGGEPGGESGTGAAGLSAETLESEVLRFYDSISGDYDGVEPAMPDRLREVAGKLQAAANPVIVCGTDIVLETTPALAADHALVLRGLKGKAGLFYLLPGANAFAAGLLSGSESGGFLEIIEAIENGSVKALVVVESDPLGTFADRRRIEDALRKLDLLVVLDYLPSATGAMAHIQVPTATIYEAGGCFVNQEGRAQDPDPIHSGGLPVRQEAQGNHPPRVFRNFIPGAEPQAAWGLLAQLCSAVSGDGEHVYDPWTLLARENPVFEMLDRDRTDGADRMDREEVRHPIYPYYRFMPGMPLFAGCLVPRGSRRTLFSAAASADRGSVAEESSGFRLHLVDWTFGTEELSSCSPPIRQAEREPCLYMHRDDASGLSLSSGDIVTIAHARGTLKVKLQATPAMARGTLIMPRHHALAWQDFGSMSVMVSPEQIRKECR